MAKLYKLTDKNGQTKNGTQWGPNVTHSASGPEGQPLCTDGWIHAYESPLIAALMNPAHANFVDPLLWEAEGEIGINDSGLKCGCRTLTTLAQIEMPKISPAALVHFCILVAQQYPQSAEWAAWADSWLSGRDRSAAAEAAVAARAAARAAEVAAARAAWEAEAAWEAAAAAAAAAEAATRPIKDLLAQAIEAENG